MNEFDILVKIVGSSSVFGLEPATVGLVNTLSRLQRIL